MSAVAIVSIAIGLLVIVSRGILVIAPAATLRWFGGVVQSEQRQNVKILLGVFGGGVSVRGDMAESRTSAASFHLAADCFWKSEVRGVK